MKRVAKKDEKKVESDGKRAESPEPSKKDRYGINEVDFDEIE